MYCFINYLNTIVYIMPHFSWMEDVCNELTFTTYIATWSTRIKSSTRGALAIPRRLPDFLGESNPSQAERSEATWSRHLSTCLLDLHLPDQAALARSSSACQTSSLARLSGWIQSHPGRVKRGKVVMTPERLLFRTYYVRTTYVVKNNRSGVVTTLPRFARPGRDWIHPESLASDEVWQALLDLASANLKSNTAWCVLL